MAKRRKRHENQEDSFRQSHYRELQERQKINGPSEYCAKSALKYHAVKHGLLTKALSFRSDEEKAEFRELAAELEEDLKAR